MERIGHSRTHPQRTPPRNCATAPGCTLGSSVSVGAFGTILEDPASHGIDTDFEGHAAAPDVEGVAKAAAAFLFLKFLVGYHARTRRQGSGTGSGQCYLCLRRKATSLEAVSGRGCYSASGSQNGDCAENKRLTHIRSSEG